MATIAVRGARDNNLRELDVDLPLGQLVVFCGRSGSGKSSLAFDTLHREGQRRYLEAMLLGRGGLQRPDVASIDGLPPTIALDQREREPSSTETVAGLAELSVPLSVLFAREGVLHCPQCGRVIEPRSPGRIADRLLELPVGTRLTLEAPVELSGEGVLEEIQRAGFSRVRVGNAVERIESLNHVTGPVRVVVDRVKADPAKRDRIIEAVRLAGQIGRGVIVAVHEREEHFVDRPVCAHDGTTLPPSNPGRFRLTTHPLDPAAAVVRVGERTLDDLRLLSARDLLAALPPVMPALQAELAQRVHTLERLGLGDLQLGRAVNEISRGERLRLRLARLLSNQVSGVLFVLDEPAAGLDVASATAVLELLRDVIARGNSVLAVDHHPVLVRAADHLVEFGPGAGEHGGRIVFQGLPAALEGTATAEVLAGRVSRSSQGRAASLELAGLHLASPGLNVIVGASGTGKTRLLRQVDQAAPARFERVIRSGGGGIARVQRSTVATVTGVWTLLRDLLAQTRESKVRGFTNSTFSLNAKGGRCETCHGLGVVKIVLDPLPDVWDTCEECLGQRFQGDVLQVRWKGHNALELLELEVDAAHALLGDIPKLDRALRAVREVGLGHLDLGRAALTLSGGEMRRLKLAAELARLRGEGLVLADEPSLGLHPVDTVALLDTFQALVEHGATVVLASNDPWVIEAADVRISP